MDLALLVDGTAQALGGVGMLLSLAALRHWIVVHYLEHDAAMPGAQPRNEFGPRLDRAAAYCGPLLLLVAAILVIAG
jgi:hypothetical protein